MGGLRRNGHGAELPGSCAQMMSEIGTRSETIHGRMRLCVTAEPDGAVARPMDGIDTSLLDSLDPSI